MAHRNINAAGLDLIKTSESFVAYPYDDLLPPVKGKYREWKGGALKGTATIGYGHTDAGIHPLKLKPGLRITEAQGRQILDVDLDECEEAVTTEVMVPLNDNQFAALVSFTFNCGQGNLRKLISNLNAGAYDDVPQRLMKYTKSKGKELRGLVNRRRAEAALWRSMPSEAIVSAKVSESQPVPETVDTPASTPSEVAGPTVGVLAGLQGAAQASSAVAEVKKNTGEMGLFDIFDHLIWRPGFWLAVAGIVFVMWWRRWPSWFWRRISGGQPV